MKTEFGVALKEKQLDEGLNLEEIVGLYDLLSGVEVIPLEIQGEYSVAMGFVNRYDAELMDYDLSGLKVFVKEILDDMYKEIPTGEYVYHTPACDHDVWLSRNFDEEEE